MASNHDGMLPRRFHHWLGHRLGAGRMEKQVKKNYYTESNVNQLLAKTEIRMVELKIILIDAQLKALNDIRRLYPAHRADGAQPSALHTAAFPS